MTSGAGGYAPGKLFVNRTERLEANRATQFAARLNEVHYWSLSANEIQSSPVRNADGSVAISVPGVDGAQWILEAVRDGKYKVVDRWSPTAGPIRDLGLNMVQKLAGLKIPDREIY